MTLPSLVALAVGALSVTPPTVPAKGSQQVILKVDRTSMVRLSTANPGGTACTLVDHLRGPFATSGVTGRTNCDLDQLLDAGVYKVRLASPAKGKGTVAVKAEPFTELNDPLLRLDPGRGVDGVLKPRQQASFWVHVDERRFVSLRVSGRTAGEVKLWRSGEWAESVDARPRTVMPQPGRPLHEWWIGRYLEAGDYLLTVYGTNVQKWTRGPEDDAFSVAFLYDPMPADRVVDAVIPAHGVVAFGLPKSRPVANVSLAASPAAPIEVELRGMADDGSSESTSGYCRIEAKSTTPECTAVGNGQRPHALVVRGAPGTRIHAEWAPYVTGNALGDGDFGPGSSDVTFRAPASGSYLVGLEDSPADPDSTPLGCVLRRQRPHGVWEIVARDFWRIGGKQATSHSFNYNGSQQAVWFEVTGGGSFSIATSGDRKSFCELFQITEQGTRTRLSETTRDPGCKLERSLSPGFYELKLYGGLSGIETLRIADVSKSLFGGGSPQQVSGAKTACLFPSLSLEGNAIYRLESNRGAQAARGLSLRPLPAPLDRPLSVELPQGRALELPVGAGRALVVAASGPVSCSLGRGQAVEGRDGCRLPESSSAETLTITNKAAGPLVLRLSRPVPLPSLPPLQAFKPVFAPLPQLGYDAPVHFDLASGQTHSLVFDVKEAGLHHLSTVGLLATACQIRTQASPNLASDTAGGRGRNCLVAGYLRPGRYLATITPTGASRGRAGAVLTRRPSKPGPDVAVDSTVFYRTDADSLLTQKLLVRTGGRIVLETLARGASLSCRLEDKEGWPVEPVPTSCSLSREFAAGEYRWVQLPLTVESMRRTKLERVRPPVVLSGEKVNTLGFNTWYTTRLGKSGKDAFLFDAAAELDVQLALTDGMQGRLYRLAADGGLTPVEFIVPQQVPPSGFEQVADAPTEGEGEPMPEPENPPEYGEGMPEGEPSEPTGEEPSEPVRMDSYARSVPAPQVPQLSQPTGQALHLAPGKYKLVLEHSRADVGVTYRLYLRSDVLAPGIARDATAPGRLLVRVPHEGVLRLRSRGEADVRCRLFDASGRLVAESGSVGDDWNCAFAEPVPAGDYSLALESETLTPVVTHVGIAMPVEEPASLAEGATLKIGGTVLKAALPEVAGDAVQEVSLKGTGSGAPFSCDVSGPQGVLARRSGVRECAFLMRPRGDKLTLRAWLVERVPSGPVAVQAHLAAKPVAAGSGSIPGTGAITASVAREGRYRTSAGVHCLPDAAKGVLFPCGPEVSLEQGPTVFAALGAKDAKLPLDELPYAAPASPSPSKELLTQRPFIQAQQGPKGALHLMRVSGLDGERSAPDCAMNPGARLLRDVECFAASGVGETPVGRFWTAGEEGSATVERVSVKVATSGTEVVALVPGEQELSWNGPTLSLAAPDRPARVELTLPAQTWAVQLDGAGRAVDLCAPEGDLSRCTLATRGGLIALWGEGERRAAATVLLGEASPHARLTAGVWEAQPAQAGLQTVQIAASDRPRQLTVEGARACTVRLADGRRLAGCTVTLPQGLAAEAWLTHDGVALRVLAHPAEHFLDGLFPSLAAERGSQPPAPPPLLPLGQASPLVSAVGYSLRLEEAAVVHVRADSGVCALAGKDHVIAAGGLGAGCELHRLLEAGVYRLLARPFGSQRLAGSIAWTKTAVARLDDGVGPEALTAPGQAQLYRFTLASAGRVGIGLQEPAETLECVVQNDAQTSVGVGCQQLLKLEAGSYLLEVRAPVGVRPTRYRPVVVGLKGARMDVPEEYLRDFFNRIGGRP